MAPERPSTTIDDHCLSDAGAADAFAAAHKSDLIYSGRGGWFRRDHELYTPEPEEKVQGTAKEFLQSMADALTVQFPQKAKATKSLLGRSRINATVELSRSKLWKDFATFDADPLLLGCANGGILNPDTRSVGAAPEAIVTNKINAAFDPAATCRRWLEFLNQIFKDDAELVSFLQRAVGYSLSGLTTEQCLFLLIGCGANGKTTFVQTLVRLLGGYAATLPMQTLMESKNGFNQTNDLASLYRKHLVVASEGERGQHLAEAKTKLITGGDRIKCRFLYKEFFEYEPTFKLWLVTNDLPLVTGSDDAIWRRIRLYGFPLVFPLINKIRNSPIFSKRNCPGF